MATILVEEPAYNKSVIKYRMFVLEWPRILTSICVCQYNSEVFQDIDIEGSINKGKTCRGSFILFSSH